MSAAPRRGPSLGGVLGIVVVLLGAAFYFWAMQTPELPVEASPTVAPRSAAAPVQPAAPVATPAPRAAAPTSRPAAVEAPARPTESGEDEEGVSLHGLVEDSDGNVVDWARVYISIDGGQRRVSAKRDGTYEVKGLGASPLTVWAERRDGRLSVRSPVVKVDATGGGSFEANLVVPAQITGGLGVIIKTHPDGARISSVRRDGAGAQVGLVAGDVVLEVSGEDIAGMSVPEITGLVKGPEGSTVHLTVRRKSGAIEDISVERAYIERPR